MKIKTQKGKITKFLAAFALCAAIGSFSVTSAEQEQIPAELDADTVEYNMTSGLVVATGDVLMKRGPGRVAGAKATYNVNTKEGFVEGNVVAVRENMRITCDKATTDGTEHMLAVGNVVGTQQDLKFTGEKVDYFPNQNQYMLIEKGGKITNKDGVFTADKMEGWLGEEHYVGIGNAHLISPPKDLEAGGDRLDYFAKEQGKAILTGNAWAVQNNNVVKSRRLILYLAESAGNNVSTQ